MFTCVDGVSGIGLDGKFFQNSAEPFPPYLFRIGMSGKFLSFWKKCCVGREIVAVAVNQNMICDQLAGRPRSARDANVKNGQPWVYLKG
jgi:hypothetical protein